ncbi:MMB_0454 family protein [Mycoplasmopsis bovis]|uniref:MMB_0454 family protein n=1 Tax=Mycoplasmopsis bovis TaxID=28903 RepID=UPI003D2C2BF7
MIPFISETALLIRFKSAFSEIKGIKLANVPRITFLPDQSNATFIIDVKIKKNYSLKTTIEGLREEITKNFETLLDFKPHNIRICFVEFY